MSSFICWILCIYANDMSHGNFSMYDMQGSWIGDLHNFVVCNANVDLLTIMTSRIQSIDLHRLIAYKDILCLYVLYVVLTCLNNIHTTFHKNKIPKNKLRGDFSFTIFLINMGFPKTIDNTNAKWIRFYDMPYISC